MQIQPLSPLVARPQSFAAGVNRAQHAQPAAKAPTADQSPDTLEISPRAEAELFGQLTPEQQQQVEQLKARDREVRAHEQAHLAAAGPYAQGGPTYAYQEGPDGRRYAIGGEVQIDTSPIEGDPQATIQKARVIRAAANAPGEPSAQDRQVAAQAARMETEARIELREQEQAQQQEEKADDQRGRGAAEFSASPSQFGALLDVSV